MAHLQDLVGAPDVAGVDQLDEVQAKNGPKQALAVLEGSHQAVVGGRGDVVRLLRGGVWGQGAAVSAG